MVKKTFKIKLTFLQIVKLTTAHFFGSSFPFFFLKLQINFNKMLLQMIIGEYFYLTINDLYVKKCTKEQSITNNTSNIHDAIISSAQRYKRPFISYILMICPAVIDGILNNTYIFCKKY